MNSIAVRERICAPIEVVFAAVSDHENFVRAPGTETRIVRSGEPKANGLGCVREVRVKPGMRLVEEITGWNEPHMYEYLIRESSLPINHQGSRLTFREQDGATEVEWTNNAVVTVPVIGGLLQRVLNRSLEKSFSTMLRQVKVKLEQG